MKVLGVVLVAILPLTLLAMWTSTLRDMHRSWAGAALEMFAILLFALGMCASFGYGLWLLGLR